VSDTAKLQERYDALTKDFVAPLLMGGTVVVDRPIAPGAIQYFQHANSSVANVNNDIFDHLHRGASAIAPVTTVPWPDRDLLLLAMCAYDLVLMTDPELDRMFARGARTKVVRWVEEMIEAIAPPDTRADALARHALLDPVPALRRVDIVAESWAYKYKFVGRPTSASVFTRPLFGKFKETQNTTDVSALMTAIDDKSGLGLGRCLRELLSRSPVTELVRLDLCQDFRFGLATLAVLSDDAIRGGVARMIVERGEWIAAPRLGRALGDAMLHHAPPAHLYYALALCFEVQMTATLDVPGLALPQRLDLSDRDTARYAAVLPAFFEDESMIDEVRLFDARDRTEVQERCDRLAAALPPGIREEVAPLVKRCQRPGSRTSDSNVEVRP
jgi:hypothetical protein